MTESQDQTASDGSTALQAGRDLVVNNGVSYTEARQISIDVFDANYLRLAGEAADIATARAIKITESFLDKLNKENPEGLQQAKEPGFQHALYTVQYQHARAGDHDLADLLVALLVDRTKQPARDIVQIVLDESLNTAPKLTEGHVANLTFSFLFKHTQNGNVGNHAMLGDYFDRFVLPLAPKFVKNPAAFQHMQFTGCGATNPIAHTLLGTVIGETYQGMFLKGFDVSDVESRGLSMSALPGMFIPCLNDPSKFQLSYRNVEDLDKKILQINATSDDAAKLKELFSLNKMSDDEIRTKCIEIRSYMAAVFDVWKDSDMKSFTLTSVGIAIAHANMKRVTGESASLSIWIN